MTFEDLKGRFTRFRLPTVSKEAEFIFMKTSDRYDGAINAYRLNRNKQEPVFVSKDYPVEQIDKISKNLEIGDKVKSLTSHAIKGEALLLPTDICIIKDIDIIGNICLYIVIDTDNNLWALEEYEITHWE